jgi:uncharacterized membrane protein HdeD (DUF308 family)
MPDPINIQNWVFNAVSIFLIVEGVLNIMNAINNKDSKTVTQARRWIQSILMIVSAVIIFWLTHSTELKVNVGRPRNNYNNY